MDEPERELLANLIRAGWPLGPQVAVGAGIVVGDWLWCRMYFVAVDPVVRAMVGRLVGARVVWVMRDSASYPTPFEWKRSTWHQWTWGVQDEARRTFFRDGAVLLLCGLLVNVLAGAPPVLLVVYLFAWAKLISYAVFFPTVIAAMTLYSIFFSGRREIHGMR